MKSLLIIAFAAALVTLAMFLAGWTWDEDASSYVACGSTIIACA